MRQLYVDIKLESGDDRGRSKLLQKIVPDYALMAGVPAKQIGWVCECGEVLHENTTCSKCGRKYETNDEKLYEVTEGK